MPTVSWERGEDREGESALGRPARRSAKYVRNHGKGAVSGKRIQFPEGRLQVKLSSATAGEKRRYNCSPGPIAVRTDLAWEDGLVAAPEGENVLTARIEARSRDQREHIGGGENSYSAGRAVTYYSAGEGSAIPKSPRCALGETSRSERDRKKLRGCRGTKK